MRFIPVKTRAIRPPKDDIYEVMDEFLPKLRERDILVIASKVLAIHQGRCLKIKADTPKEKNRLIRKEADWYVPPEKKPGRHWHLTIKNNTLIADAGIDKSNGNGYYILWPKNLQKLVREINNYLKKKFHLKKLAVIVIDSHRVPLRIGTIGISMGFLGLNPWVDYRGKPDIFGRKLGVTRVNLIDSIAAFSNLLMGEGKEQTPLLILRDLALAKFEDKHTLKHLSINPNVDVLRPLLKAYRRNKRLDKKTKIR